MQWWPQKRCTDAQVAAGVQFYVAGASVAAAAGAAPWTRAARLPLMALFGGALAAERCLPPRLHRLLAAGDRGQASHPPPLPSPPLIRPLAS